MGGILRLGTTEIAYDLAFSDRRTLGITVRPSGALSVTAPAGTPLEAIHAKLVKRGAWILSTRRAFDRLRPATPPRRYVAGETHRFLGRQYRLRVEPDAPRGVTLSSEHLTVGGIAGDEPRRIAIRLCFWYQREARRVVRERFDKHWSSFGESDRPPRLIVRPMEKRWGSLSATGRSLIINQRLVEADIDAIDFVLVHELCHLRHHDHGEEFYALLTTRMPDWRTRKDRLERWMM